MKDQEHNDQVIRGMESIARMFYSQAIQLNFHQFVEFNGFLTEYIKLVKAAHEKGHDFVSHGSLPIQSFEAEYIAEKFGCIFSDTFRANPEAWAAFKRKLEEEIEPYQRID